MKRHLLALALITLSAVSLEATDRCYNPKKNINTLTDNDREFLAGSECCIFFDKITQQYYFKSGPLNLVVNQIGISDVTTSSGLFSTTHTKYVDARFDSTQEMSGHYTYTKYHPLSMVTALGVVGAVGAFTWKYMQQAKKTSEENS